VQPASGDPCRTGRDDASDPVAGQYPQLDTSEDVVPRWLSLTVLGCEMAAFAVPAIVCTVCNRKAKKLGHPVKGAVMLGWGVFGFVAVVGLLLWFFG